MTAPDFVALGALFVAMGVAALGVVILYRIIEDL